MYISLGTRVQQGSFGCQGGMTNKNPRDLSLEGFRYGECLGCYFSVLTNAARAFASSADKPESAFLCGAFLASFPLVSRSVI